MESTVPPSGTFPLPRSTPVKTTTATTLPFTTNQKYRHESITAMAEEISKYLVGPMPAQQFLDEFFPSSYLCVDRDLSEGPYFSPGCYSKTVSATTEMQAYIPFVSFFKTNPFHFPRLTIILFLRSRRRRSSSLASKLSIHLRSWIVIRGQISHSKSSPISLSTLQTPRLVGRTLRCLKFLSNSSGRLQTIRSATCATSHARTANRMSIPSYAIQRKARIPWAKLPRTLQPNLVLNFEHMPILFSFLGTQRGSSGGTDQARS